MNGYVPLTLVALEVGGTADELAARFGDAVVLDDAGIRCVSTDTAREFITAHHTAVQAERDQAAAQRAEAAARPFPLRARVAALAAAQAPIDGPCDSAAALQQLIAADPDSPHNRRLRALDEQRSGVTTVHRIVRKGGER